MRLAAAWFLCGVFADMTAHTFAVTVGHEMHAHNWECVAMNAAMAVFWAGMAAVVLRRRTAR